MRRPSSIALSVAVLGLVVLAGCLPEAVIWSPDGQWGIVVVEKEHYVVCDSNGKLSKPFLDLDTKTESITPAAWLPDSRQFVIIHERRVDQKALSKWLVDQKKDKLLKQADRLRQEILDYKGDWKSFKPSALQGLSSTEKEAAILHLRHSLDYPLPEPFSQWKLLKKTSGLAWIRTIQLGQMVDGQPKLGQTIVETLDKIATLRVSPDGKNVAYVCENVLKNESIISRPTPQPPSETQYFTLFVAPIDGSSQSKLVARGVAIFPDWSSDSQSLVYVAAMEDAHLPIAKQDSTFGMVSCRRVASKDGLLLKQFDNVKVLATLMYWPWEWVGCLDDGRILITGVEVTLPAAERDMPEDATLFVLDPKRQPAVTNILIRKAQSQLPKDGLIFGCVTLSPDKKLLAVIGQDNKVCIVTLATGEVTIVQDNLPNAKTDYRPSWRTNDELCLVAPAGSKLGLKDRESIVLWSKGKSHCISQQWPEYFKKTQSKKSKK